MHTISSNDSGSLNKTEITLVVEEEAGEQKKKELNVMNKIKNIFGKK